MLHIRRLCVFGKRGNLKYHFLRLGKASKSIKSDASMPRIIGNNKVRKLAYKTDTT